MDRAKYKYDIGKHRTVTADELEKANFPKISYKDELLICTECGEYVTFVSRDKHRSYFRHSVRNANTQYCDLRVERQANYSIYERVGLPLYLKKSSQGDFELYMGFYDIGEDLMNRAQNEKWKVTIMGSKWEECPPSIYFINRNNFLVGSTTLKKIDFISSQLPLYLYGLQALKGTMRFLF